MKKEHSDKLADGPVRIESFRESKPTYICASYRMTSKVIDSPAYVRGPPKQIPRYDAFLAYLEWKSKLPWWQRWSV